MAKDNRDGLDVPLGVTTDGAPKVWDISKMPHLLIAGATGSGKSVFVHSLITSLLFQYTPDELRMVFVDPKAVELTIYDGIPHLLHPAVTASERAQEAVDWLCDEMERRYGMLSKAKVRNIQSYHNKARKKDSGETPYILLIVDEWADLRLTCGDGVEKSVVRLAQKARAVGIHLILATQRPSVDVISGLIKANFPARISFKVSSQVDSKVILDESGAEHLLGRGDMLFRPPTAEGLIRLHGAFLSDEEIERVVQYAAK